MPPEAFRRQRHQVEVLSILRPELRTWFQSWDLGISYKAVHGEARRRLYGHMKQFIAEQADWIEALLTEAKQQLPMEQRTIRAQTTVMLAPMFTQEDWQAFADTAAREIAQGVLQARQQIGIESVLETDYPVN